MFTLNTLRLSILIAIILLEAHTASFSQPTLADHKYWIENLSSENDDDNSSYKRLYDLIYLADSSTAFTFLNRLEGTSVRSNSYFKARFNCLKAWCKHKFHDYENKSELNIISQDAVNEAYESHDDHLIAFISFESGTLMIAYQEIEQGATFLLRGQEMFDRLGEQSIKAQYSNYVILGEVLFHCREYEKSIYYTNKVIQIYNDTISNADYYRARFHNTVGQNYLKLGKYDSAMFYFEKSLELSMIVNDEVWKGINAGFIGQILHARKEYDKAVPFLRFSYDANKNREYAHAAKSLQYLASIDLVHGRLDSARSKCDEALRLLKNSGTDYYLQAASFLELVFSTFAEVYRAMGNTDSFYHYNRLYATLHDSIQQVAIMSSTKVARLRIDNENNYRAIRLLEEEKNMAEMKRNFLILAIVLVSVIIFLYVKRLRLKEYHKEQFALVQKNAAEAELALAKEQMQQFTGNIVEKSDLIEKLKLQLVHREVNSEHQRLIEEISHQTILTEQEWENFKSLFEKIYPGFFTNLRDTSPDITVAELRMAALTRLNLTTRQMATMLGISVDSVHKSRQRLRQRLHVSSESNLEESVSSF